MIEELEDTEKQLVMFFDEGRFGLRSTTMRVWAEKGKTLTVKVQQGFKNFYGYSSVCPFNGENFSLILPDVNTETMNYYLSELSQFYSNKRLILIMDQAGWHRSKELKIPKNIKILFLPPYSPELNPIEKLWEWIKKECTHNIFHNSLEELMDAVSKEFMNISKPNYKKLCNCSYLSYYK